MSVREQKLSRGNLYRLLDFIEFCRCADGQNEVVSALKQLDDIIPFQAGIVGLLNVSGSSLKQTVCTVSLGHSPEFLENYSRQAFAQSDPLVACGLSGSNPFSWEEAISSHTQPATVRQVQKLLELSADYGLKRGLAYASRLKPQGNEVSYICLETGESHFRMLIPKRFALRCRICTNSCVEPARRHQRKWLQRSAPANWKSCNGLKRGRPHGRSAQYFLSQSAP